MAWIEVYNLCQEYGGRRVLKDINLEIGRGEVFALIGPTGAGKTTLIRLLDLLDTPKSGQIRFDGVDINHSKRLMLETRRRMSFVQQKPIVFTTSVYNNVACGLRWRHESKDFIRGKVNYALELVGLTGYENRPARELSGGEIQRIALARALVTDPEVLFLDEPTANLDPVSEDRIEEALKQIIHDRKITVVMATHNMPQGHRLASEIGVLMDGEMLQVGTPSEIFCSPKNRRVAEFVGVENILPGEIVKKDGALTIIKINGHSIDAVSDYSVGDKVDALVRPEEITFTISRDPTSARNIFEGTISRMTPVGSLLHIEIDCGFPLLGVLTVNSAEELELALGRRIYANFKATAIHLIRRPD